MQHVRSYRLYAHTTLYTYTVYSYLAEITMHHVWDDDDDPRSTIHLFSILSSLCVYMPSPYLYLYVLLLTTYFLSKI